MNSRLLFLVSLLALPGARPASAEGLQPPAITKTDVFKSGDYGYRVFHIPGIVVTRKGTVIAWCEARKQGSDWDDIDLLLRRSTDEGQTWGEPIELPEVAGPKPKNPLSLAVHGVRPLDVTYNNPMLIAAHDGTVHALFCLEYMRCFHTVSTDDGLTWSAPVEITSAFEKFRPAYDWKVLAVGPDHGLQLKNGRLLVPVCLSLGTGGNAHRPSVAATIYSDGAGKTWQAGDIAVPNTAEWVNPNETMAVQLSDGRVMLNVRNESKPNRRLVTISPDGATHWSEPRFDDALVEPICMASIIRYSPGPVSGKSRILFANPDNLDRADGKSGPGKNRDRKNLTIRMSEDEGATWPVKKVIDPGYATYSDLAVTKSGQILCIYGRAEKPGFAGDRLTLARFPLDWVLLPQEPSAPSIR